jgi:hypothetical protein
LAGRAAVQASLRHCRHAALNDAELSANGNAANGLAIVFIK